MKKTYAVKFALLLVLAAIAVTAVAPLRHGRNPAGPWMGQLEDSRPIADLSIPGTHDSGALYSFAGLFGKCQSLPISQQLQIGVRYLDLRLRLVDNELRVYHNFVEQKAAFDTVLETLVAFLQENPTEFLILSLKEEDAPLRSDIAFAKALEEALLQYPQFVSAGSLPDTVGSARGKIHILSRHEGFAMGVDCAAGWESNTAFQLQGLYIQDHYKLEKAEDKLPDLRAAFEAAATGEYKLVLNHASCYLTKGLPPSYAGTTAHTINPWLLQQLQEGTGPAGVVICDFITSELSGAVIGRNFS